MAKPKVLVVGINPWVDNTGINTLINFFEDWGADEVAHIYTREGLPNTHICNHFFQISELRLIKSILSRNNASGKPVSNQPETKTNASSSLYKRKHSNLMTLLREFVWLLGKWKTPALSRFLDDFAPDVLFFPTYSTVYMNRLQNYIAKYTKKPVVLYASDDNYSYQSIQKTPLSYFHRFWLRTQEKQVFKSAQKIMVISPKMKEEYDQQWNTDCVVLTKGIDYSTVTFQPKPVQTPIKMVYTGKLIIGRWKSLAAIAEALGEINATERKIELDIYTTDTLTDEQSRALNRNGCSVKGALALNEVNQVQSNADILVFVESLEKKYRYTARLSFSTKITDYLKSGKCVFAIGAEDIAPIDYFNRYDSAITATSYAEIPEKLQFLASNHAAIAEYAQKAFACGKEHHDREITKKLLEDTISSILPTEASL